MKDAGGRVQLQREATLASVPEQSTTRKDHRYSMLISCSEDFVIAGAGESQDVAVDQVGRIVSQHGRQLAAACQV